MGAKKRTARDALKVQAVHPRHLREVPRQHVSPHAEPDQDGHGEQRELSPAVPKDTLNSMRTLAGLACIPDLIVSQLLEHVKDVQSVDELLFIVLELCEKDVEMNMDGSDKGLLPRILSLLYVSHKGLTADEIFECVQTIPGYNVGTEHKRAVLVILKDICMVVEVNGIIHMENEAIRRVVWQQYICDDEHRRENHHIMSLFF